MSPYLLGIVGREVIYNAVKNCTTESLYCMFHRVFGLLSLSVVLPSDFSDTVTDEKFGLEYYSYIGTLVYIFAYIQILHLIK